MKEKQITMMAELEQIAREALPDGFQFLGLGNEDPEEREFVVPDLGEFAGMTYDPSETFPHWVGDEEFTWTGATDDVFYACPIGSPIAIANGYLSDDEPEVKATNPKDRVGVKKVPMSGMPINVLLECGLVKLHGDMKYGAYNWRDAGVRGSVYYDACIRHLAAWMEGEDLDPDSGVHHISHAITGLCVLRDSIIQENWTDDRPPASASGWISELNAKAAEMIESSQSRTGSAKD